MIGQLPFAEELQNAVGSRMRIHPRDCEPYAVCGEIPKLVVSPRTIDEAARAARVIADEQESLIIRGAGTKSSRPPAPQVFAVMDMSQCDGVIAHEPGDLTVTVAAGTRLAHLQSVLARHEQFFPCDAPFAARATVGGTLAAYATGALRQRYGTLRDLTLGLRVALSNGKTVFTGARVVKSVAGYDGHKLFVGSFGTLGVIGEATLKVAPLPLAQGLLAARFARLHDAAQAVVEIAKSNLFVLATTLHDAAASGRVRALPAAAGSREWLLLVRCGGNRSAVRRQIDGAARYCKILGAAEVFEAPEDAVSRVWADVAELAAGDKYADGRFVSAKFVGLPTSTTRLIEALLRAWPDAEITAHPAFGVVFAHVPAEQSSFDAATVDGLWNTLDKTQATGQWLSAPPAIARDLRNSALRSGGSVYARRLRRAIDPHLVFDPGRGPAGE